MLHGVEHRKFSQGSAVTPELIGVNDLWHIVFTQKARQEGRCRLGITVTLQQDVEHEAVLVDRSPQPVSNAVDRRTDLVHQPAGTPSGFPLAQVICEQCAELDAPFAQGLVTDLDAALVEQFLNVSITQRETVVQPDGVLDDGHRESVAVRGWISHSGSDYPGLVKATQPGGSTVQGLARSRSSLRSSRCEAAHFDTRSPNASSAPRRNRVRALSSAASDPLS